MGNDITISNLAGGVSFDIDADGTIDKVAWPKSDPLLAFDRNGNGSIDNGGELFGDNTFSQAKNGSLLS